MLQLLQWKALLKLNQHWTDKGQQCVCAAFSHSLNPLLTYICYNLEIDTLVLGSDQYSLKISLDLLFGISLLANHPR